MDMHRLEELIYEAIVEQLAIQVVEKLQARLRKALVLFTGTELGLSKVAPGLIQLKADGFDLHSVLTQGGRKILTPALRLSLGLDPLLANEFDNCEQDTDTLLDGHSLVLVPAMSITTAAKVACCIRDCLGASLVARALERGIPVIAAIDGCCPDNPERKADLFMVAEAYKTRLRAHLECLQSYGIQLVRAGKLAEIARSRMTFPGASASHPVPAVSKELTPQRSQIQTTMPQTSLRATASPVVITEERRLFSRTDALDCKEGSELRLGRNILITPLAIDVLRNRNVRLIQT